MKKLQQSSISGKRVYIFEDHATALSAWAKERRQTSIAPNLITLDCHTDTHTAFTGHIYYQEGGVTLPQNIDELSCQICSGINYENEQNIEDAVSKLRHDEHIDCAVKTGIISSAFVISYFGHRGTLSIEETDHQNQYKSIYENGKFTFTSPEPFNKTLEELNYAVPDDKIFIIPADLGYDPSPDATEEEQHRRHCDLAVEKSYLDVKLKIANKMAASLGVTDLLSEDFILDIDLDYFRTARSINPQDTSTFYKLIRRSAAITIALEPKFVIYERVEGENITSDFLYPKLLKHIENALKIE